MDPAQFAEQLLHRQAGLDCLGLFVQVLQQRDAEHAVKGMHLDLAVGPVVHRPPAQLLPALEPAEHWSIYEVSDYLGCGSYGSRVVPD